jgi:hypothetical protein
VVGNLLAGKTYDFDIVRYGERQKLSIKLGVRVTDDIRKEANIAKGLNGVMIVEMNGKQIGTIMDFYKALNDKSKKDVSFKVNRKGTEVTVGVSR